MQASSSSPAASPNWARRFFTIWSGQAFSLVGSAIVQFSLVWWLTQKTGSATVLATASLVALLPQILLGPFVGALIDRWNRRLIMLVADTSIAVVTGVLIFLFATGRVQVWHIYVVMLLRSLGGAFHGPAMTSSTSLMVPDKHLARVAGMNQTLQGVIGIFAPPLGALLLSLMPTGQVLFVDIGTAALAVIPLLFIPIPQPPRQVALANGSAQKTSYWHDLKEGYTYVIQWKGLLGLIILAMLLNFLLSPASALTPLFIKDVFQGGAQQLAWAESVFGVGVIVGGLALSAWGGFKRRIITSFCGIIGIGLGILMVSLTPSNLFWLFLVGHVIVGSAQVFANGPLSAIFQSTIAPDMQGRVFSLLGAGATAMMPLSLLMAGPLSDWLGIRTWFMLGGILCVLMTVIAFFIPVIVNIEQNNLQPQPVSASASASDSIIS
jgi:DHA3 family macrolide efflux protein-like MFS transporter